MATAASGETCVPSVLVGEENSSELARRSVAAVALSVSGDESNSAVLTNASSELPEDLRSSPPPLSLPPLINMVLATTAAAASGDASSSEGLTSASSELADDDRRSSSLSLQQLIGTAAATPGASGEASWAPWHSMRMAGCEVKPGAGGLAAAGEKPAGETSIASTCGMVDG
eukprot:scaffold25427_cov112-Isochrysis_galbana.AAC.6